MGIDVNWIGVGLSVIGLTCGAIAYSHTLVRGSEEKMRGEMKDQKTDLERLIETERGERISDDDTERADRRREHDRLETAVESFRTVSTMMATMAEGLRHLGERFDDQRKLTNDNLDEIKYSMRSLDQRFQALPGASTATRRVRQQKG